MKFKLLMFTVLLAVVMAFVYQNSVPVTVRFFNWEYALSFALLLMSVLAVGVMLGMLLVLRRQSYNKKKKIAKEAEQQKVVTADITSSRDGGSTDLDPVRETPEQEKFFVSGEDDETNNIDNRSNSGVR